jgi:hypothetical protein
LETEEVTVKARNLPVEGKEEFRLRNSMKKNPLDTLKCKPKITVPKPPPPMFET